MKEFLSQRGVTFIDRDISTDETAFAELEQLHLMTTLITKIDGDVVVGFDREKLERLLS